MMMAMLCCPPQHALLRGALREEREHQLKCAARRVGAMREVAMVAGADRKDAQPIEHDAEHDRLPGDAGPDRRNAGKMHHHAWDGGRIDDVVVLALVHGAGGFIEVVERHAGVLQAWAVGWGRVAASCDCQVTQSLDAVLLAPQAPACGPQLAAIGSKILARRPAGRALSLRFLCGRPACPRLEASAAHGL